MAKASAILAKAVHNYKAIVDRHSKQMEPVLSDLHDAHIALIAELTGCRPEEEAEFYGAVGRGKTKWIKCWIEGFEWSDPADPGVVVRPITRDGERSRQRRVITNMEEYDGKPYSGLRRPENV